MRFIYQYRSRDNVVHRGEIVAGDRESAFRALKEQGVKPAWLEEAPGFLNKLLGKGKRWIAIGFLAVVTIVLAVLLVSSKTLPTAQTSSSLRHQIYGDPAFLSELERDGYCAVFSLPGECKLARFAQPGVIQQFNDPGWRSAFPDELCEALTNQIVFTSGDRREVVELKQIVNGMKDELRRYLSNGNGTYASYVRRLVERQEKEWHMFNRAKVELADETDPVKFEKINMGLRAAGLRTIPAPNVD